MNFLRKCISLLGTFSFFFFAPLVHAATITGTVVGPDGEPFKGAFVEAQNLKTRITVIVLSQKDGQYRIENLPAGVYDMQIRAIGYKAEPRAVIDLTTKPGGAAAFALQRAAVLWSDLSIYQGEVLLPNLPGKEILMTGTPAWRDAPCQVCHSFQNKMAPFVRDEAGWRNRVDFMRTALGAGRNMPDHDRDTLVSYLTAVFGPKSILPWDPLESTCRHASLSIL